MPIITLRFTAGDHVQQLAVTREVRWEDFGGWGKVNTLSSPFRLQWVQYRETAGGIAHGE
jgi:hypothetical protein